MRVTSSGGRNDNDSVDLADHQRFSFAYLFGASVLMTLAGVAFGVLPI